MHQSRLTLGGMLACILTGVLSAPIVAQSEREDTASQPAAPSAGCGTSDVEVGQHTNRSTTVGDDERSWAMYVPSAHDGVVPLPLWIQLHGATQSGFQHVLLHKSAAEDLGVALVAPDASVGSDWMWKFEDTEIDASRSNPDIALVDALIDELGSELCLDLARVYAAGFSAGGGGVSITRCAVEDRVAAVASVAALWDVGDACELDRPLPFLAIHGRADQLVLFDGGMGGPVAFLNDYPLMQAFGQGPVLDRVTGIAERNGCAPEPTVEVIAEGVERWAWTCPDGADVELIAHEGGHVWLPDFTELIWEFFERHALPE